MIILNSKNFKSNSLNNSLNVYNSTNRFIGLECPYCKSDDLIKWGKYQRNVFFMHNNKLQHIILEIKRLKCNKCNKTHALIPAFIVPYKQPSLDVLLLSIGEYNVSFSFPFSYDTVETWKRIYRKKFLPYLKTMFNNIKSIIPNILNKIFNTYIEFYIINNLILMMSHKGIFNMVCF